MQTTQYKRKQSLAEVRMKAVMRSINKQRNTHGRMVQEEICYLVKVLQDYGMKWFPNHYLMSSIERLEEIVVSHQNTIN